MAYPAFGLVTIKAYPTSRSSWPNPCDEMVRASSAGGDVGVGTGVGVGVRAGAAALVGGKVGFVVVSGFASLVAVVSMAFVVAVVVD